MELQYVFRLFLNSESDAIVIHNQLTGLQVKSDYVKADKDDPGKWKLIFMESGVDQAKYVIAKLKLRPKFVDFFDPTHDWRGGFKPLL